MKMKLAALAALGAMYGTSAMAALDPAVQAAIDVGTADGKTLAYSLLAFAVAIGVIVYIKRKAA